MGGREVSVVGIAVDYRDKVLEFADRFKIGYPLLIGEQDALDAAASFGVESPVFLLPCSRTGAGGSRPVHRELHRRSRAHLVGGAKPE